MISSTLRGISFVDFDFVSTLISSELVSNYIHPQNHLTLRQFCYQLSA